MRNLPSCVALLLTVLLLCSLTAEVATAQPGPVGGEYRADIRFPEYMPMWREGWAWFDDEGERVRYAHPDMLLGGYLYASFRNSTSQPLSVKDVLLEGVSLAEGVAPETTPKGNPDDKYPSSLKFSKLPAEQLDRLVAAGEPVWWKVEPLEIPPGGFGQVTVRLRRDPRVEKLTVRIPGLPDADGRAVIATAQRAPWFFSVNFAETFDEIHAYLRHPSGKGVAPQRILVDNRDVTARCRVAADPAVDTVAVVIKPDRALKQSTWHLLQADYADGMVARVNVGAWQPGLVYGMWGYSRRADEDENRKFYLEDMRVHHINTLLYSIPGEVRRFLRSEEGQEYSRQTGIRAMTNWSGDAVNAPFMFLTDEPDAGDFRSMMLDPDKRIGSLAQYLIARANMFRREEPTTPVLLNIDNTFKPENWYTYAQLADVPCADPYYQEGMQSVYKVDPVNLGAYLKPTYVLGVGEIYQSAGAPKPMHLILHTCRFDTKPEDFPFRGPTVEEKRIEVYYALAAGAKALSYWWYTPYGEYYGVGGDTPDMKALWKEIGLLGAEVRTAEPVILYSSPAKMNVHGPRMLWLRTLVSGTDTLVVIVANENIASDRLGTVVKPVEKARIKVDVPSWIRAADVFEVDYKGTRKVDYKAADATLTVELGQVDLTRMILVTSDAGLRARLQERYEKHCAANVAALLAK